MVKPHAPGRVTILSTLVVDLRDLLGRKVDVVSEDGLYWLLRRRIVKEAKSL
ncbi:MAG: hypothetical protein U9N58_06765 [Thermodesulfobacteriota bacterium]|nr:hypothetical protein [Thermodesulfobacteriota bacterium]